MAALALTGGVIGSTAALGLVQILASEIDLHMIVSFDATALGAGLTLVIAAAAIAAWFPGRRAARIEPVSTLCCD
jgi:ABC-type antimicrobial peptide transport system permease subunit